jgi:hypothetical protein
MKKLTIAICFFLCATVIFAQNNDKAPAYTDDDALFIREIYNKALTKGNAYDWLNYMTNNIGGRLAGSPQAAAAVEYTRQMMDTMGMEVTLQPCMVPHWVRGDKEIARVVNSKSMGTVELDILALGNSVGTDDFGLTAPVVEVKGLQEVMELGKAGQIKGKIVFYNRPMDPTQIKTFNAYGGAVDQRVHGAAVAANYGAVGSIVRSMTLRTDDIPHTGSTIYNRLNEGVDPIPAVAISTMDADLLSKIIQKDGDVDVFFRTNCRMLKPEQSYNVIGEIKGSEFPDEIILVGGHLDSWDVGTGAHDDGSGCVHSMDVYNVLKQLNYKPKRTIRVVMFMNEENGLAGALEYTKVSNQKKEYHLAAIESDRGGFSPRGFTMEAENDVFPKKSKKVIEWLPLLQPYGLELSKGGSGADISRLKTQKGLLFGLAPDSQRYFDYHHTPIDVWDAVNKRELQLGVAAMASLVYLIDKYGL